MGFYSTICIYTRCFLLFYLIKHTQTYDSERFTSAKETVRSPVTIEKEQETERKTRESVQSVEEIFDAIAKLVEKNLHAEGTEADSAIEPVTNPEKVQRKKQILFPELTDP